jgi:hypothetical protein
MSRARPRYEVQASGVRLPEPDIERIVQILIRNLIAESEADEDTKYVDARSGRQVSSPLSLIDIDIIEGRAHGPATVTGAPKTPEMHRSGPFPARFRSFLPKPPRWS